MTNCIFKTERYPNGCQAQDGEVECSEKCAFYKTEAMQEESLAIAEERLRRKRTTAPLKRPYKVWTEEETEELRRRKGEGTKALADHFGVSEHCVYSRLNYMKRTGKL